MTDDKNISVCIVPESYTLSILESNFSNFDQQNRITSNILLVGKVYEDHGAFKGEQWINVQLEFSNESDCDSNFVIKRLLQVIFISNLTNEIILSEPDAFNLMKTACPSGSVSYIKPICKLKYIREESSEIKPVKASEVKICLLKSLIDVEPDVIDVILLNYFKFPRFFYKNDIFTVDVVKYLPELQYTKGYSNIEEIYFKVCDITGPKLMNDLGETCTGFLVDDTVMVYQVTTKKEFLPPKNYLFCNHDFYKEKLTINDFLKPLLPLYLQKYAEKLMNYFRPFMVYKLEELQLKPLFVVGGPVGSGKKLLLLSVAKRLGLQYWCIECTSLILGPSGFNEAKLKSVFARLKNHTPCLLQLNNIEVLSENRDGNADVRIVSYFNKLLAETKSDLPFIIVGTTGSIDKLSCELLQSVLDFVNIDGLSLEERADAISWISDLPQACALQVASRTSGFTLSDLSFLVSQTSREKYKTIKDKNGSSKNTLDYNDFSIIVDRMNAQIAGAIGAPQVPTVAWTDVGGHNEIKREIVRSLETTDFCTGLRRSGILLWGPPGTGKTLLAKAVANECKSTFLSVKGPELLNMYIGQSEQNVRQVFERAREARPCIIFFDELDSLAPNRGKGDSLGVMDRVVSQLLSEMDGLQKNDGVFVLGATNRPDLIDPALLRPGRLDKMLYVGPCEGTEAKLSVLKALTRKFKMSAEVDLFKIADSLPLCLTGADLYSVCYNAWQNAARSVIKRMQSSSSDESSAIVIVTIEDFNSAVNNLSLAT